MKLALLALALLAPLAFASHSAVGRCDGAGVAFGILQLGDGTPERTFYLDDRNAPLGAGAWLYQESNGIFLPHTIVSVGAGLPPLQYWYRWIHVDVSGEDPAHSLQRGGSWIGGSEICFDNFGGAPDTLLLSSA